MKSKTIENSKRPISLIMASILSLSISTTCLAEQSDKKEQPKKAEAAKSQPLAAKSIPMQRPKAASEDEDMTIDPAKRLTLKNFTSGLSKLNEYLTNAVKNADDENKKFLVKEKLEIERQVADPKAAYDALFVDMEAKLKRMEEIKIFRPILIAKVRKHFMQTEAAIAGSTMRAEAKLEGASKNLKAEVEYQLGIIAERDMVNYKTALRHYSKAVGLNPSDLEYINALGRTYLIIEDGGSAKKLYQEVVTQLKSQSAPSQVIKPFEDNLAKAVKQLAMAKK